MLSVWHRSYLCARAAHPDLAVALFNLGRLYIEMSRDAEAEPLLERSLAMYEELVGADHPNAALVRETYAGLLRDTGRPDEADRLLEASGS